jgi:hypothetical protein
MYRYKIVPPILLILSLINFLLAAPVVLREVRQAYVGMADVPEDVIPVSGPEKRSDELEKRRDEYSDEPWRKRGMSPGSSPAPSVGEPPASADQELASNYPPSPQTQTAATSKIQDAAPVPEPSLPEINNKLRPPSDEDYPGLSSSESYPSLSSGGSYPSDHGYTSSENPHASDEGGPLAGPSKSYSDSSSKTDTLGAGSNDDGGSSPGSSKSYPPSDGPGPNLASNEGEGRPGSSTSHPPPSNRPEDMVSTGHVLEPPVWNPHDWSTSSSEGEPEPEPKKNFMSDTKNFFDKMIYKIKFWPRASGPGVL